MDMCIYTCIHMCKEESQVEASVYRHVYRHAYKCVYKHVYVHVYKYGRGSELGSEAHRRTSRRLTTLVSPSTLRTKDWQNCMTDAMNFDSCAEALSPSKSTVSAWMYSSYIEALSEP